MKTNLINKSLALKPIPLCSPPKKGKESPLVKDLQKIMRVSLKLIKTMKMIMKKSQLILPYKNVPLNAPSFVTQTNNVNHLLRRMN